MTSTSAARASLTDQCGSGWVSGTPGASTSAAIVDQSSCAQILHLEPGGARIGQRRLLVVEHDHVGAAGNQRAGGEQPRLAEAEDGDFPTGKRGDWGSWIYLNFSVARPASASTTATIQKRITICGSVQPSCSK